jgi:hypothetical protein
MRLQKLSKRTAIQQGIDKYFEFLGNQGKQKTIRLRGIY